jgi:hypothetical protein
MRFQPPLIGKTHFLNLVFLVNVEADMKVKSRILHESNDVKVIKCYALSLCNETIRLRKVIISLCSGGNLGFRLM